MKILWFCKTGGTSSLARITDSILPILKTKMDITLLSNKTDIKGIKSIVLGEDTKTIQYKNFIKDQNPTDETIRGINMKYFIVQLVDEIYEGDYDYVLLCNGVYEIDWFCKIIKSSESFLTNKDGKKTKLITWSPIDYIPSKEIIENVVKSDIFITMTPVMMDICKNYYPGKNIKWLGHGSNIITENVSRDVCIDYFNNLINIGRIISNQPLNNTDIIILNANNNPPYDPNNIIGSTRKRIDLTVKSFIKLIETTNRTDLKLWIHMDNITFFKMLRREKIDISKYSNNLIISNNNFSDKEMCYLYTLCDVSLQTSFAEGWSMTNMEAALFGSIQIVPDFLACGYHFSNGKGILIPTKKKESVNQGGNKVIIGLVEIDDVVECIIKYLNMSNDDRIIMKNLAREYASSITWEKIADDFINLLY